MATPPPRQRLAIRRKHVGFSQEALAERLEVDRSTIGRWEAGITSPRPRLRTRLADALEISLDDLDNLLNESDQDNHEVHTDEHRPGRRHEPQTLPRLCRFRLRSTTPRPTGAHHVDGAEPDRPATNDPAAHTGRRRTQSHLPGQPVRHGHGPDPAVVAPAERGSNTSPPTTIDRRWHGSAPTLITSRPASSSNCTHSTRPPRSPSLL